MTSHVLAPIAGMRMDWAASVTKNSACVSRWRSGMGAIPSLKNALLALPVTKAIMVKMLRKPIFIWMLRPLTATCITVTSIPKVHFPTSNWCRKTAVAAAKSHPFN